MSNPIEDLENNNAAREELNALPEVTSVNFIQGRVEVQLSKDTSDIKQRIRAILGQHGISAHPHFTFTKGADGDSREFDAILALAPSADAE